MEYPEYFIANLANLHSDIDSSYPDMTLHCMEDDTRLKCHRIILAASSDYFKRAFRWSESDTLEVRNGITGVTMKIVLKYIYSGKILLTSDNVNDVLVAANFFGIAPIVNLCIDILLDNLNVDTCIEVLLFAWQLDLVKLKKSVVTYVANNFSEIMNDRDKLSSLPVQSMASVLGSNDLVIRNMKTNLPTRPAEREKQVLNFILSFTKNLEQYSNEDMEMLLSCVKWQFIDIFDEKEYVLNEFAAFLDNGKRAEEVKKRLKPIKHSPWFLQSPTPDSDMIAPKDEDRAIYGTRAFSCAEIIWSSPVMGDARLNRNSTIFKIVADAHEHISRIDLISRVWACGVAGRDINVLGGLNIYMASPSNPAVCHHYGLSEEDGNGIHTIQLDDGEHITTVHGRSGLLVDQLTFETSKSRLFGPFLGEGGSRKDLMANVITFREEGKLRDLHTSRIRQSVAQAPHPRIPLDTILVGVSGASRIMQDDEAINNFQFAFRLMTPGSAFLISSERKSERQTTTITGEVQRYL